MITSLQMVSREGSIRSLPIDAVPGECPHCKGYGTATPLFAVEVASEWRVRRDAIAVFQCSAPFCGGAFVAAYAITAQNGREGGGLMTHMPLKATRGAKFSETISELSPTFCATYDQSIQAEENGLTQICGAGFRRALEYLVKDFAVSKTSEDDTALRERIAKAFLGSCIRDHLPPGPVQEAAKRAAWLGNDETHYYRTWTDRDITDLKALIQLTVKWIDFTIEMNHFIAVMPSPKA